MLFAVPKLTDRDLAVLELIHGQRDRLRVHTQTVPKRWVGSLRRSTLARAIRASNSIEGIHASLDDVLAAVDNGEPMEASRGVWLDIKGYRDALTYILQAAEDPSFELGKQFIKSLHFMILGHDLGKNPGRWRPGAVYVVNQSTGAIVYDGPDAGLVDGLVGELIDYLRSPPAEPVIVRAAMAHLNLAMIHPFKDGNGRVARALQTFVLGREGIVHPAFSSIEEWLGEATQDYYAVLAEVGQGRWNPERDALPWVKFCLKAHYRQGATLLRRNDEYEKLFGGIQEIVERRRLPERSAVPLFNAALGQTLTNAAYRREADVSELTASRDLKKLSDLALIQARGERRGRVYVAGEALQALRKAARIEAPLGDPYGLPGFLAGFLAKDFGSR